MKTLFYKSGVFACLLVLACAPADTQQLAATADKTAAAGSVAGKASAQTDSDTPADAVPDTRLGSLPADNREIKLARLGTPSLIWREGPVTILQYAGMTETRGTPDCTLLIFLDEQGQPTSVQTRPASGAVAYEPVDEKSCLRAWRRKRN